MPPQAYNLNIAAAAAGSGSGTGRSTPVNANTPDRERGQPDDTTSAAAVPRRRDGTGKSSRSSNKILGDYTLSKVLGAGSMGKVKLAIHNVTGEKVGFLLLPDRSCTSGQR